MNENTRKENHDQMVLAVSHNSFFLSEFTKEIVNLAIDLVWDNPNPNGLFTENDISHNVSVEMPDEEVKNSIEQAIHYGYFIRVGNYDNPDIFRLNPVCYYKTVLKTDNQGE